MPLTRIDQGDQYYGCFVACVAMVTRTSYEEAFKLVHPKGDFGEAKAHGIKRLDPKGPAKIAYRKLKALGLQPKKAKQLDLGKLKRTAICIIRWSFSPTLLHAVVWDAEAKQFLDPSVEVPYSISEYQRQVETIIYLEPKHDPSGFSGHRWGTEQSPASPQVGEAINARPDGP